MARSALDTNATAIFATALITAIFSKLGQKGLFNRQDGLDVLAQARAAIEFYRSSSRTGQRGDEVYVDALGLVDSIIDQLHAP